MAEALAQPELDEKEETADVVEFESFDSSQLSIHAGNWCEQGAGRY